MELSTKIAIIFEENSRTTDRPKGIIVAAMWVEKIQMIFFFEKILA